MEKGILYIVATPIGNLEDITLRALRVLREADIIAAEDTRRTAKLLNHFEIKKQMVSFHEHSQEGRYDALLQMLEQGKQVALLSDAGTPLISDPGEELVRRCIQREILVESVPGACAAIAGLTVSGISARRFLFLGFLDSRQGARQKQLLAAAEAECTCVAYESPNRIIKAMEDIESVFGAEAQVSVLRELTKLHEEKLYGSAAEVKQQLLEKESVKGEFVVVIGRAEKKPLTDEQLLAYAKEYIAAGASRKDAAKKIAEEFGASKNRVYGLINK
ncbi:MAG: 16S rRNA (cytidine(1402)-2'-O)-methyltransferase [Christensenellaceae bacterium]|jgi:16S rRNA (cytidine1402-2'-O)-methyltransferase